MAKALKITITDFQNASRDMRELSVLSELGHNVIVMAKGEKFCVEKGKDFVIHRLVVRGADAGLIKKNFQRLVSVFVWASYARKLKPDCISGHDMFALLIGWMSTWFRFRKNRPLLVYDAHEFEVGRNTDGRRGAVVSWLIPRLEKFLMKKCAFSIMVNDTIADAVQAAYKLTSRPVVVRNIAPYWIIDQEKCLKQRQIYLRQLAPSNSTLEVTGFEGNTG